MSKQAPQKQKQTPVAARNRPAATVAREVSPARADTVNTILGWQQTLGNQAVQRRLTEGNPPRVQRGLTDEDKAQNLTSPRFAGDVRLEAAYDNSPALAQGARGDAVAKVQQGLIDDGFPMPRSVDDTGQTDGIYGSETRGVVIQFQDKHGLGKDGIVGRETMGKLDALYPAAKPQPKPQPPVDANEQIIAGLEAMSLAQRHLLRGNKAYLDGLQSSMSDSQFARATAALIVDTPATVDDPAAATAEARRIITAQLQNKAMARGAIDKKVEVVIVPRSKLMTDVPQFSALQGKKTFDGREWDAVRGSGGMKVNGWVYTAITEENLLGVDCTAKYKGKTLSGTYDKGYSTSSHEFAHTLHIFVMDAADKATITAAYTARKAKAKKDPTNTDMWVDGREGCYASMTEHEFFAQLSNAYLGTNGGTDPYVKDKRHNSKDWVKAHEPDVYKIIDRMYVGGELQNTNPRK